MGILKRFFLSLLFISILFLPVLGSPSTTFAQTQQPQTNPYAVPNTNGNVPQNLHTGIQSIMIETMAAMTCQLIGIDPVDPHGLCLGIDMKTGKIGYLPSSTGSRHPAGAIGFLTDSIGKLYVFPVRTHDYFAYLGDNFGFPKKALAAGCTWSIGFCGLSPLLLVWSTFRNLVYFAFAVVFAIVGLAIMLRIKIDPRTVMTIENQIPKMIIAIILITFSFAIAGLLVDAMYVLCGLIFNILHPFIGNISLNDVQGKDIFSFFNTSVGFWRVVASSSGAIGNTLGNLLGVFGNVIGGAIGGVLGYILFHNLFTTAITQLLNSIWLQFNPAGIGITARVGDIVSSLAGFTLGATIGTIFGAGGFANIIAFIIILVAVLIALFRTFVMLLLVYFSILLDVVLVPFWIVLGILPGAPLGFGAWLRSMVANLLVFPGVIALFLLTKIFIDAAAFGGSILVPPGIGDPVNVAAIQAFFGIAGVFLAPSLRDLIREGIKPPESRHLGPALARGFGGGTRGVFGAGQRIGGTIISSREAILRPGGAPASERGIGSAILGNIFGRR